MSPSSSGGAPDATNPARPRSAERLHRIGGYVIVGKLGEGGMGAVYEGRHEVLGHSVAVKVLHPRHAASPAFARRFLDEARAPERVAHPGVARVFECARLPDGTAYLVMELVRGESLRARARRDGRLGAREVIALGGQVAEVLAAAHARGVVHRDLKPDNVMIVADGDAPRVKVLDFGVARVACEREGEWASAGLTATGEVLGTPRYMAPEQCRGDRAIDGRADVYALGVMLYELLAGRAPFEATSPGELLLMHLTARPQPLREAAPGVRAGLAVLVHAMLSKSPDGRPAALEARDILVELGRACAAPRDLYGAAMEAAPRPVSDAEVPSHWALLGGTDPAVRARLGALVALGLFTLFVVSSLFFFNP